MSCAGRFLSALQVAIPCLKTSGEYLPWTWNVIVLGECCRPFKHCRIKSCSNLTGRGKSLWTCNNGGKQSNLELALGCKVKICILKQGVRKSFETKWLVFPMGKTIPLRAYSFIIYWVLAPEREKPAMLLPQLCLMMAFFFI